MFIHYKYYTPINEPAPTVHRQYDPHYESYNDECRRKKKEAAARQLNKNESSYRHNYSDSSDDDNYKPQLYHSNYSSQFNNSSLTQQELEYIESTTNKLKIVALEEQNKQLKNEKETLLLKLEKQNAQIKKLEDQLDSIAQGSFKSFEKIRNLESYSNENFYEISTNIYVLKEMVKFESEKIQDFRYEFNTLKKLNHPLILRAYKFIDSDETQPSSIVLERYWKDMDQVMKEKLFTKIDILFSIYEIAKGLNYIHSNGIAHNNLNAFNIKISHDKKIKICGFAVKPQIPEGNTSEPMFYIAPEVLTGQKYTEKVDVFAFGSLIFILLNDGKMPDDFLMNIVLKKKQSIPSSFNNEAKDLISNCWNETPENRPSFEQIVDKLKQTNINLLNVTEEELIELKKKIAAD